MTATRNTSTRAQQCRIVPIGEPFPEKAKVRLILLDCADYLIYYTRKEVTYELLTHEYNYWR